MHSESLATCRRLRLLTDLHVASWTSPIRLAVATVSSMTARVLVLAKLTTLMMTTLKKHLPVELSLKTTIWKMILTTTTALKFSIAQSTQLPRLSPATSFRKFLHQPTQTVSDLNQVTLQKRSFLTLQTQSLQTHS